MKWTIYSREYVGSSYTENLIFSSSGVSKTQCIYSPSLSLEINKSAQLSFVIQPGHSQYDNLHPMKTMIFVYADDELLFRGRVIDAKTDFYKQKSVTCESDLAFLLDSICPPIEYTSEKGGPKTIKYVFDKIVTNHNSQVEDWKKFNVNGSGYYCNVTISENSSASATDDFDNTSYSDSSSALNSLLLEPYGGVLKTRTVNGLTFLDYVKDPFQDIASYGVNSQEIKFAVNLLDINRSYPISEIFTVLLPVGKDKTTISSVNSGSNYLEDQNAIARFGRIVKCETWSDIDSPSELKSKGQEFLNKHAKIYTDDLEVRAIDLHVLDNSTTMIKIGDRVRCYSEPHGIDETLVCLQIKYDLFNPENNTYKIGSFIPSTNHKDKTKKNPSSSSRGGSGSSGKGISSKGAGAAGALDQAIENEIEDNRTQVKNAMLIVGNHVKNLATGVEADLEEADLIDLHNNLKLPSYVNYDGNTVQVKDLCTTTEDVLITAHNIALIAGGDVVIHADGSIDLTAMGDLTQHASRIQINADDIAEINGRYIQIGFPDGSTEEVSINAQYINITGIVTDLVVERLQAEVINTIRLSAQSNIYGRNIAAYQIIAGTFLKEINSETYHPLATENWVMTQIGSATSSVSSLESRVSALERANNVKWSEVATSTVVDAAGTSRAFIYAR